MSGRAKLLLRINFQVCLFLLVFFSCSIKASADVVGEEAPKGLDYPSIQNLFNNPVTIWGTNSDTNRYRNAFVMANNGFSPVDPYSAIGGVSQPLDSSDSTGYMWSKSTNMLDITKAQTFGFWVALSPGSSGKSDASLAFVLQNDPNTDNARATLGNEASGKPIMTPAEGLGVWAPDTSNPDGAIKNSWALELDSGINNTNVSNNAFDIGLQTAKPHIASNYPDESSSYLNTGTNTYQLIHQGVMYHYLGGNTSGYYWHHLKIKYSPNSDGKTADVTYTVNDKNQDGTKNTNTGTETLTNPIEESKTETIDLSKFHLNGGTKLYWGFTGSTGSLGGAMALVLESVPTIVDGSVTSQLIDSTQDNRVLDDPDGNNYINSGDNLTYKYQVKYNSGTVDLKNILATINLPSFSIFKSATVTFANGNTETIPASEVSKNVLTHTISSSSNYLNDNNKTATVEIHVGTVNTMLGATMPKTYASFKGDTYTGDTYLPGFIIRYTRPSHTLSLTSKTNSSQEIQQDQDATIDGNLKYSDGANFDTNGADIHVNIDGKDQDSVNVRSSSSSPSLDFNRILSGTDLKAGTHTITIYASDSYYIKSNSMTFTVVVDDKYSKINASDAYSFRTLNGASAKIIKRQGDWPLSVTSKNSSWELDAQATPLMDGNKQFAGYIIYDDQNTTQDMQNNLVKIGNSNGVETGTISIPELCGWTNDTGVLLQSTSDVTSGNYAGQIAWTLVDSVE
ncbi:L-type lectin family protein [Companilactobacillus baiquanensis]|uniref:Cell surface protein n=1 Tax=Companilactobacillus baiquanensis TaxID=2486005 RepID=A0ABW1V070_9LACO|nr:hypothetical protein [Companilactobacillus baiquanensis]